MGKIRKSVVFVIVICVIVCCLIFYPDRVLPHRLIGFLGIDTPLRQRAREEIVQAVQTRKLNPDSHGAIRLPPSLADTTWDGKVFVTRKANGWLLILFPDWRGHDANMNGYLYSGQPLTNANTDAYDEDEDKRRVIRLHVGDVLPGTEGDPVEIFIDRKLEDHWFRVSRGLVLQL